MSALRDYYGVSDTDDWARNLWWNYITNKFYVRNTGFLPPKPNECVLLGKE